MKEMILVVRNKKDEEITLTLEAHKVPVSVSVGSSSIDLDIEEIGELIQVLHTVKAQHKTFVNVQPMGVEELKQSSDVYEGPKSHHADYKKIEDRLMDSLTVREIQLKVGQKYKSVDGDIWTVEREIPSDDWRYKDGYRFFCKHVKDGCISAFMPNGNLFDDGVEDDDNLIELVEDGPAQKDKDENGRWILNVGDQVKLSNGLRGEVTGYDERDDTYRVSVKGHPDQWFRGVDGDVNLNTYHAMIKSIIRK